MPMTSFPGIPDEEFKTLTDRIIETAEYIDKALADHERALDLNITAIQALMDRMKQAAVALAG